MSKALQRYDGPQDLDTRIRYASSLAHSTLLPAIMRGKDANVFYGVEYARMVDIPVLAAITGIHVIDGKPTASAGLMTALVRRAGHKFRIRTEGTLDDGTLAAIATVIREDDPEFPFESRWTIERALRAKLLKRLDDGRIVATKERSAWDTYLEAMLKARATSEVCREAAEEALYGIRYTAEELGADVDEEGQPVYTVTQVQQPAPAPAQPRPATDDDVVDAEVVEPDARAQDLADAINAGQLTPAELDEAEQVAEAEGYLDHVIRLGEGEGTLRAYIAHARPHITAQHAPEGAQEPPAAPPATEEPAEQAAAPQEPAQATEEGTVGEVLDYARAALEERSRDVLADLWKMASAKGLLDANVIGVVGDDDLAALDLTRNPSVEAGTLPLRGLLITVNAYVDRHGAAVRDLGEPAPPTPAGENPADPWATDAAAGWPDTTAPAQ